MVVEYVDAEEEHNVDDPAAQRDFGRGYEKGRPSLVELGHVARDSHEEELRKCQERSLRT